MKKMTWSEILILLRDAAKSMEAVQHTVNRDGNQKMESDALLFVELECWRSIDRIKALHWKDLAEEKRD